MTICETQWAHIIHHSNSDAAATFWRHAAIVPVQQVKNSNTNPQTEMTTEDKPMTTENTPSQQIETLQKAINERAEIALKKHIDNLTLAALGQYTEYAYAEYNIEMNGTFSIRQIARAIVGKLIQVERKGFIEKETRKLLNLLKDVDNPSERVDGLPK